MAATSVHFEDSQPIFRMEDMRAALRFHVDILGFENADWGTEDFTSLRRDRAGLFLCRGAQGRGGAWVWVGVDDVRTLHAQLVVRGVPIRLPPTKDPKGSC